MIKITISLVVAAAMLLGSSVFAGDKACCAKGAHANKAACLDFASLNLTANQKSKLETWQSDCMKAGCTEKSRTTFLRKAKKILSADQYAKVMSMCDHAPAKKA
jgi:hypothetical protein